MDAVNANATIDPKLFDAIKHWNDYANESGQNARVLFEAMTPVKDSLQIARQVMESMQHTSWMPIGMPWMKPSALFSAYQELTEIQLAAQERESDCYIRFLTTTLGAGKQVAEAMQGATTPQQVLASYLEAGLNIVRQYQADVSEQASTLSEIQSAYNAWLQRTLENLGTRTAMESETSASLPIVAPEPSLPAVPPAPAASAAPSEPAPESAPGRGSNA
ncbi:hypothetical protein ACE0DR_08470 [Azotobacter sp. CWF10]